MGTVAKLSRKLRIFQKRIRSLISHPVFAGLTLVGNATIFLGALLLYLLERHVNSSLHTPLNALWWAVATVTTVGYGDVIPITAAGKVLGMGMMIFGVALFWSFTALFGAILVAPELSHLEREIHEIEETMRKGK